MKMFSEQVNVVLSGIITTLDGGGPERKIAS